MSISELSFTRGKVFFHPLDEDYKPMGGEIDIGNCTALTLQPVADYFEHKSSHSPLVSLDNKPIAMTKWKIKITPEERSVENMLMAFLGQANSTPQYFEQVGGVLSSYSFVAQLDRWVCTEYRCLKPGSIKIVSHGNADLASLPVADYRVNYETGSIMFCTGNSLSINDGDIVTLLFKYGTVNLRKIITGTKPVIGQLRYIGNSAVGTNHNLLCRAVQIAITDPVKFIDTKDVAGLVFEGDLIKVNEQWFELVDISNGTITYITADYTWELDSDL